MANALGQDNALVGIEPHRPGKRPAVQEDPRYGQ